jgi:long-subunit acyl-CoA synthetase (AMP-forming)
MNLLRQITEHARIHPDLPALEAGGKQLKYAEILVEVDALARFLRGVGIKTLALDLDNGLPWALLDLAALAAGVTLVPIPPFFSPQQVRHCLRQAGVQVVVSDNPQAFRTRAGDLVADGEQSILVAEDTVSLLNAVGTEAGIVPEGIAKITYTSGTTGEPKGVMLKWDQIESVVKSLSALVQVEPGDRHLALMPLAVLLENLAGLYTPLWAGATAVVPSLSETGLRGAAGLDAQRTVQALDTYGATTAIFTPQILQGVVNTIEQGAPLPKALAFVAVGGAPVSDRLLDRARHLGLFVYQGYGLSECASVTTLNTFLDWRRGSVGRPLPHLELRIADDGEVLVAGNLFAGYLGEPAPEMDDGWWRTGDIGYLDDDGYLFLTGRRRNVFITAFGRNVAPEWVERELVLEGSIAQAAVFGEARPWNAAVLVPAFGADSGELAAAVAHANQGLPDYARITEWIIADQPFTPGNGQLSGTGRIRRHVIHQTYEQQIESLYKKEQVS